MCWTYHQSTGALYDGAGRQVGCGYSGHGAGLKNLLEEQEPNFGPIPRGTYGVVFCWTGAGIQDMARPGTVALHKEL